MSEDNKTNMENQNAVPAPELEEGWDPANLAATLVIVIVCIGLLFWLFWSLMVAKSLTANIIAAIILLILVGEIVYVFKR